MRLDYRKMQEEILPSKETQDWMWEEIEKAAGKGGKKQHRYAGLKMAASIAAAVFIFAALIPQTSWADRISGFVKEFFYAEADIRQDIVPNVYEDEGEYGHVRMKIQEMLSDGACAYCTICYEALDAEGEQWLKEQEFNMENVRFPYRGFEDVDIERVMLQEQEELATEKTRYFALFFSNESGKFSLKDRSIQMVYPMYKSQGVGWIKIISNLDTVSYRLVGEVSPSKYYEPKYLIASKVSYAIFGEDHGLYEYWTDEEGMTNFGYSKGFAEEKGIEDNGGIAYFDGLPLSFTMKDGSQLDMGFAQPNFTEAKGISGADLKISVGWFNVDSWHWEKSMPIDDPNELTGIEIDGVHYDLVKEETADK